MCDKQVFVFVFFAPKSHTITLVGFVSEPNFFVLIVFVTTNEIMKYDKLSYSVLSSFFTLAGQKYSLNYHY